MWESISRADLNQAKQGLNERRFAMLRRHAEELGALDDEQAEIETLERFIVAFIEKFQRVKLLSSRAPADGRTGRLETHADGEKTPPSIGNLMIQHFATRERRRPWDLEAVG